MLHRIPKIFFNAKRMRDSMRKKMNKNNEISIQPHIFQQKHLNAYHGRG